MNINIDSLKHDLINTTVPKPLSGTLSGHAAGEPFDKHVFKFIKEKYPNDTFRQYEYLNKIYLDNPTIVSINERWSLLRPASVAFLLNRGRQVTQTWSPTSIFAEKQNDTADILVVKDNFFNIIDVKTFSTEKNGQPPNIISAYKLAKMCALMLEENNFSSHDITYISITWELVRENLKCTNVAIKELFKTDPSNLYINWAAAMQVQFYVSSLGQSYSGDVEKWCKDYLESFVSRAHGHADKMEKKFIGPFQKFLE